MSRFSTSIREVATPRFFVLGKGFSTKRLAALALAKKEMACYAAIVALPAFRKAGQLKDHHRPLDALGCLFDDWTNEDHPNFREGSEYKEWIHARARALMAGAPPLIRKTTQAVGEHDIDCWKVGYDLAHPWPKESEILGMLHSKEAA